MKKQLGMIAICGALLVTSQFAFAQAYRQGPPPPGRYHGMYDQGRHEGWYKHHDRDRDLAATVFRYRAQEGRKGRAWRGKGRWLPLSLVVKHGVENNEELAHTGDERGLGVFIIGTQPQIESSDGGIAADSSRRFHI